MIGWRSWLRMLIGLVLVIGLFDMLLPETDLKKLAKLVMGLVIMLAVLQPITALLNVGWDGSISIETTLYDDEIDWGKAGEMIYDAGSKPVLQFVTNQADHQMEALLIANTMVADAKITTHISEDGTITKVNAAITLCSSREHFPQEEIDGLEELTRNMIARYLQVSQAIISVEFA